MKSFILVLMMVSGFSVASTESSCEQGCTFVLKSQQDNAHIIINETRANTRLTPFSTFKVPNTLIALDLGLISSLQQPLDFDREKYPVQNWWPQIWHAEPLSIRAAFQHSAVPIYQQLASQITATNMQGYLDKFDYGNKDISSGIDSFWLNASIKISALEQVAFLQKLFSAELAVSAKALSQLKQIMLVEQTDAYSLYAKTGGGQISKDYALGWYVGVVESKGGVYYFAANLDGQFFSEIRKKRINLARHQLKLAGII